MATRRTPKPEEATEIDPSSLTSVADAPAEEKKPKPAARKRAPYAVVGAGPTDDVVYSVAKPPSKTGARKSLTVHHLQRRLNELGFHAAYADIDGRYGDLTVSAVEAYQESVGAERTGVLTREQFALIFDGDPNVTVLVDTGADH